MGVCVDFATRFSYFLYTSRHNAEERLARVSCLNIGECSRSAHTNVNSLCIMIRQGRRAFTR